MASFAMALPYTPTSTSRGTVLVSNLDFSVSSVVFTDSPEVTVLYSDHVSSHCNACYAPLTGSSAHACKSCSSYSLCEACNNPSRVRWHDAGECKEFGMVPAGLRKGDTDYLRWFLRYFDLLRRGPYEWKTDAAAEAAAAAAAATAQPRKLFPCPFANLVSLSPQHSPANIAWSKQFASLFSAHCSPPITTSEIETMLLRLRVNDLGYPYSATHTLGWSLSSQVCLMNHSCKPTCAVTCGANGVLEVKALRPIKAGDELTISYIDLTQGEFKSVVNRRAALSDKYLFSCQCERCAVEETELVKIKLTIPAGAKPGMILQLDVDGVTKRVTVPEGVVAGQEIVVTV
jgi:hypothetical protein